MLKYDNYREEYLEDQRALVLTTTEDWEFFNYPTVDQLKQTYSNENFTPDTRHYFFKNDRLVGFLSTALENQEEGRASLQFPFVRKGFEEIETKMMEKAFKKLEEKNAKYITSNIPSTWTGAPDVLTKYGFEKREVVQNSFRIKTTSYDYSNEKFPAEIVKVDPVADREELIRVFSTEMTQTPDEIGAIIDRWQEAENIFTNIIAKKDGKIISHSMVLTNQNNPETVFMTHVSIYDDQYLEFRPLVAKFILNKIKKAEFEMVNFVAIPNGEIDLYAEFNFPSIETVQYRKDL